MSISTSYTPIVNSDLPLKSRHFSDAQLKLQSSVNVKSQAKPETLVTLNPNSSTKSTELSQNVSPTYTKPVAGNDEVNAQTSPENKQSFVPSMVTNETINNSDDTSEGQSNSKIDPVDEQSTTQSVSQTDREEHDHSEYSEEELALIDSLKLRDSEVETHERAHAAVGAQYAGSPSYSYKTGPDGVKYAVSGEVSIDTSRVAGDPHATLQKAQQIKAAALAPAEPSGQDRKVAAKADQMATQARSEILQENRPDSSSEKVKINSSKSIYDTSVPEHFSGQESQTKNDRMDNETQMQMHDRNLHINELYQNSAKILASSHLNIQA